MSICWLSYIWYKAQLGLHVKCLILLSDFKIFSKDFNGSPQYQISQKSVQWELRCCVRTEKGIRNYSQAFFWDYANKPEKILWYIRTRRRQCSTGTKSMPAQCRLQRHKPNDRCAFSRNLIQSNFKRQFLLWLGAVTQINGSNSWGHASSDLTFFHNMQLLSTTTLLIIQVFWYVTPCWQVNSYRRF